MKAKFQVTAVGMVVNLFSGSHFWRILPRIHPVRIFFEGAKHTSFAELKRATKPNVLAQAIIILAIMLTLMMAHALIHTLGLNPLERFFDEPRFRL